MCKHSNLIESLICVEQYLIEADFDEAVAAVYEARCLIERLDKAPAPGIETGTATTEGER